MQIGTVTNQYINNYHYEGVQLQNQNYERQVNRLEDYQKMQYQQQQYRDYMRYVAYIMMMQMFAKNQMWSLIESTRLHRTLDITA